MSTFRVGMRVRIVGCLNNHMKHMVGREGRIIGQSPYYADSWYVDTALRDINGLECSWGADALEPILYEGMQPTTWDKCLWQPKGVTA